ncbi:hypothetical protein QYE76_015001 [Lolium multiflorum]|uniref:Transposase (putative) gypsy type domain-containing protein n=1 Tax=Lolium multiflorum TaxID=4521 RepID=A0AAD8U5S9_LOLMU|nr:hypothetical protein QYE76_015001 [Lolium multiflorum]
MQRSSSGATGGHSSMPRNSPPPSAASTIEAMAQPSGSWEGSIITADDVERLRRTLRIPAGVETRIPGEEVVPDPEPGERVFFISHFERGFGLPASAFFRAFLDFFGLQPHHLPANACVTLSCYVPFCEGYAGLWPDVEFWSRLFYIKAQTMDGQLRACGAASLYSRPQTPFPKIPTVDSMKKWQATFFYVKNENPAFDWINLPEFSLEPPTKLNWGHCHKPADPEEEVNVLWGHLRTLVTEERLTAMDLLCCYASRRVLLLQARSHKICHMSGRFDPTWTSKLELSLAAVAKRVNWISLAKLPADWQWGMEPYRRDDLPPLKFAWQMVEDGDLALKVWAPDHANPADRAAGDDRSPEQAAALAAGGMPTCCRLLRQKRKRSRLPRHHFAWPPCPAPIKFSKGAGAGLASGVLSPPPSQRARREPTPQPPPRARMPPVFPPPAAGAGTSSVPSSSGAGSDPQVEPARRSSQPTIGDLLLRRRPEGPTAGASRATPEVVVIGGSPRAAPLTPPESVISSSQAGQDVLPPAPEPPREGPASPADTDARALVKAKGPAEEPQGPAQPLVSLHVSRAASLLNIVSAPDSSLGSAGTMEKEWRDADVHEVTSQDKRKGMASMEMFFSDFRAFTDATGAEANNRLKRIEKVHKSVTDKRTGLYNWLVASYHKAKTDRAAMARELEVAQAVAARVPQLEEDLRVVRVQCAESQEVARALAANAKETEGELLRLRRLEANHLAELAAVKRVE